MRDNCKNMKEIKGYDNFSNGPHLVLIHTLSNLLSADVRLQFDPIKRYKELFDLDILITPKRTSYRQDDQNRVFIISYANTNNVIYLLGITLSSPILKYYNNKLFHHISTSITKFLCTDAEKNFKNCMDSFGEPLIIQLISKLKSVGFFNRSKIAYLINTFKNLRSTTFEGKYFSTGIILTKSIYLYKQNDPDNTHYLILPNEHNYRLYDEQGRRFWFMANGIETFFIADLKTGINAIYMYEGSDDYVSDSLLESRLSGGDVFLRVLNGRELSIIDSDGCEFIHQECVWKYRDYKALKNCLNNYLPIDDQLYYSIMKYILRCSREDKSSILWVVKDEDKLLDSITNSQPNNVLKENRDKLNIKTPSVAPIVDRLLASDGATVINLNGDILCYGVFADLSQKPHSGVKGSGETAASILGQNGLAIKVSQDGPITIYVEGLNEPISF